MRVISPITKREFLHMFRKCLPPGQSVETRIGVANSGGPDSTCLLFLIHRCLTDESNANMGLPSSVVSLTVDHALQLSSSTMAEHCAKTATSLGIDHITTSIPWSEPPFPPRPAEGQSFERIARDARYHLLFHAMTRVRTKILAFGHHADDQVETSLMRLGRSSTEFGAGGMRKCRRWGMGFQNIARQSAEESLGWAGYEGMNRWILRPLLDVSKDRILATCEENSLQYVNDPTNFQPEVSIRNAVRQMLIQKEQGSEHLPSSTQITMPVEIAERLAAIESAAQSLQTVDMDISGGREQLRASVKSLTSRAEDIDSQVDSYLHRCAMPSPTGTFLLLGHNLSSIQDPIVRSFMIVRIIRYVSFHPWGSIRAEANRRRESLQQIVDKLWEPTEGPRIFVGGGGVIWIPVIVRPNGFIKFPDRTTTVTPEDRCGWLASRQPPLDQKKREARGICDPLQIDLTDRLVKGNVDNGNKELEILYDCRFLLRFRMDLIPDYIARSIKGPGEILLQSHTRWYWPMVVWRRPGQGDKVVGSIVGGKNQQDASWSNPVERSISSWVEIEWIRSLKAI